MALSLSVFALATAIVLPPGVTVLHAPLVLPPGDTVEIAGDPAGSTLRAAPDFRGPALIAIRGARSVRLSGFTIDGNRAALRRVRPMAPSDVPFATVFDANGVLVEDSAQVEIARLRLREVSGFAVLVRASRQVTIDDVVVEDSGSRNANGRNNTSGGILLEDGVAGFRVRDCRLTRVLGNGIWTHSVSTAPRARDGVISGNSVFEAARDGIQVGHAVNVRVEENVVGRIGQPLDAVDVEGGGTPVGIDTAGNVAESAYARNVLTDIDGECIDLDGFHDGEVRANACLNPQPLGRYPLSSFGIVMNNTDPGVELARVCIRENVVSGTRYGAVFAIGRDHEISGNVFERLNLAGCAKGYSPACPAPLAEPDQFSAGVYVGASAVRPAASGVNCIEANSISGYGMDRDCVRAAPRLTGVNRASGNVCIGAAGAGPPDPGASPVLLGSASALSGLPLIAPGVVAVVHGRNLAMKEHTASPPLPAALDGVSVFVRGSDGVDRAASLVYASPGQVNYIVPAGTPPGLARITVKTANGKSASYHVDMRAWAPALLPGAAGYVRADRQDGSTAAPPGRGEVAVLHATGLSRTAPVQLLLDGTPLPVEVKPDAPGMWEVRFKVPANVAANPAVRVTVAGVPSQDGLRLPVAP